MKYEWQNTQFFCNSRFSFLSANLLSKWLQTLNYEEKKMNEYNVQYRCIILGDKYDGSSLILQENSKLSFHWGIFINIDRTYKNLYCSNTILHSTLQSHFRNENLKETKRVLGRVIFFWKSKPYFSLTNRARLFVYSSLLRIS